MKRPNYLSVLGGVQWMLALLCVLLAASVLYLGYTAHGDRADREEAIRGMRTGAALIASGALLYAVAAIGLWRRERWGWFFGATLNVLVAGFFLYDAYEGGATTDARDIVLALSLCGVALMFFAPPALRLFRPSLGHSNAVNAVRHE